MRSFLFLLLLSSSLIVACGSGSPATDGGAGDLAGSSSGGHCATRTDCRLYSSYCNSAPCQCLALPRDAVDPPCVVGTQSCLVDPCLNKSADCVGGSCVVSP